MSNLQFDLCRVGVGEPNLLVLKDMDTDTDTGEIVCILKLEDLARALKPHLDKLDDPTRRFEHG